MYFGNDSNELYIKELYWLTNVYLCFEIATSIEKP